MRILFLGTPEFAAEFLEFLVQENFNIVAVISQKDKPKGRGLKLQPTPVKEVALKYNIPVFQPNNLTQEGLKIVEEFKPDIGIVVAFGRLLKKPFLDALEFYNVHASLLPKYRGAAPIQRAIENGERLTGVTIFRISEGMDDGDIALQRAFEVGECETFGDVYQKMVSTGKELLKEFLLNYPVKLTPQDHSQASYAPKIEKDDLWIDFSKPAECVRNKIRAYDPVPGVRTRLESVEVKLFGACEILNLENVDSTPGKILEVNRDGALISTGNGAVRVKLIQFPSKRPIHFFDAKNGGLVRLGSIFGI
ncbi:methionyl-tRNA formyltransferase [Fervidobacterium thailandense]|uniref:Methionyl-tRNA formyltransferase n=1 Tax=Fervidobacterium thailandense TaxID=1008305 RepID=A0A1E3G2E2_9BACT|nr:methionyl-tRNA formyltransferase [Fervidobacterium thailandense]ODN30397.1 methionyl-tRNA formyltransferase [Fervidobacterium thailandense]